MKQNLTMNMISKILIKFENFTFSIPLGKDKIRLMAIKQKAVDELPLNNNLILEENHMTNKVKNLEQNGGYKLLDKNTLNNINNTKKINNTNNNFDIDSQVVGGKTKNFDEMVDDTLNKGNDKRGNQNEDEEDTIPANEYSKAEPLIPILGIDLVKLLFSKYWRKKEDGIRMLTEEIKNYPHGNLLNQFQQDQIITAVTGASSYLLNSTVPQVLMSTLDLLKITFNIFKSTNIQGYNRQELNNYIDKCLIYMLERVGDSNLKLKERAESTTLELAGSNIVGSKVIFEHVIAGQVKKTQVASAKHISGRLNLLSRMIQNFGVKY